MSYSWTFFWSSYHIFLVPSWVKIFYQILIFIFIWEKWIYSFLEIIYKHFSIIIYSTNICWVTTLPNSGYSGSIKNGSTMSAFHRTYSLLLRNSVYWFCCSYEGQPPGFMQCPTLGIYTIIIHWGTSKSWQM